MKVAFVTTMKRPDAPVPSGDRTFARLILAALERAGHAVVMPAHCSTWCKTPDGFAAMREGALAAAETAVRDLAAAPPDAVLTYHNYHKGPDIVGPELAAAFGVPYAIVEASRAPSRADGPWAEGFRAADAALEAAGAIGAVTKRDRPALDAFAPEKVLDLPPFIDTEPFVAPASSDGRHVVCAAMMRAGRKAESLRVLAAAFALVRAAEPGIRLTVAGDGEARGDLEPLFAPGTFVGLLDQPALAALFARADLFVWPAIEEPFGFVFLEAQAAGLPVVGGASRGVVDVVRDGETGLLVAPEDPQAIAEAMLTLIRDPDRRAAMAAAARRLAQNNDLAAGAVRLDGLLHHAAAHRRRLAGAAG
ncbi:MAG: glycosyltransferase family 4 protein [Pseudomonadota bacterium]